MLSITFALLLSQACPGYGAGAGGDLNAQSGTQVVNEAFALAQNAAAGQTAITLEAAAALAKIPVGALVLLHQTQAQTPSGVGATSPFNISSLGVGRFAFMRVASVAGASLTLTQPLPQAFAAPGAQLVLVPQYATVTIGTTATLAAPRWNGSSGGLLVLAATGEVRLDGTLSAQGLGFRGGAVAYGDRIEDGGPCPLTAFTGESFNVGGSIDSGFNVWSGGGGAVCSDNGGGGGGNVGEGGTGGLAAFSPAVAPVSRGGAAVIRTSGQVLLGGGGGGAFGDRVDQVATPGARGGGVVFVRAASMRGGGRIDVDGEDALQSPSNGSGGGGAAGTIVLELGASLSCGILAAHGGRGGDAFNFHGVGAGGGGGRIQLRVGALAMCPRELSSGVAGIRPDGTRPFATPTSPTDPKSVGELVLEASPDGDCVMFPTEPLIRIRRPVADEVLVGPLFCFDGTASGQTVGGSVDGQALAEVGVLATQQWRLCLPGDLPSGAHTLVVQTFDANGVALAEATVSFRSRGQPLVAGCGCGNAGEIFVFFSLLVPALTLWRRPRTSAAPSGANTARKREAGGIPARSRHCDRAAPQKREARAASRSSPLR